MTERFERARTCLLLFDFLLGHTERDAESHNRFAPVIANAALDLLSTLSGRLGHGQPEPAGAGEGTGE